MAPVYLHRGHWRRIVGRLMGTPSPTGGFSFRLGAALPDAGWLALPHTGLEVTL
jgi:hypothetical protein